MDRSLTKRQSEVLDALKQFKDADGITPTISELAEHFGFSSRRSVTFHLEALERKGFIHRTGEARGINIVGSTEEDAFMMVPLLGVANAGQPLALAEEDYQGELTVDKKILQGRRKVFGLELKGDSMDNTVINGVPMANGNYVIVAKQDEVQDGDIVVAVINDGATVKKYKRDEHNIVLYPNSKNPVHKPIYVDGAQDSFIAGKVLTVLHNPNHADAEVYA